MHHRRPFKALYRNNCININLQDYRARLYRFNNSRAKEAVSARRKPQIRRRLEDDVASPTRHRQRDIIATLTHSNAYVEKNMKNNSETHTHTHVESIFLPRWLRPVLSGHRRYGYISSIVRVSACARVINLLYTIWNA